MDVMASPLSLPQLSTSPSFECQIVLFFSAFSFFAKFILVKKLPIITLYLFIKNDSINHKQISACRSFSQFLVGSLTR